MAIKRWNANTSQWELVGTPGTVTPAAIGAASLSGNNVFTASGNTLDAAARIRSREGFRVVGGTNINEYQIGPFYNFTDFQITHSTDNFASHTQRFTINTTGSSGIGDLNPDTYNPNSSFNRVFAIKQSDQVLTLGSYWQGGVGQSSYINSSQSTSRTAASPFFIQTGGLDRMRFGDDGNIQISNQPVDTLRYFDIYNTHSGANAGAIIRLITNNAANTSTTSADIVKYRNGDFNINNYDGSGKTQFIQTDSVKMFINGSGNIGMSSSFFTADAKLHIASVSSLGRGFQISLTDGSYTGDGELLVASRASTSAFNYLRARSDGSGDNEFILRGDGIGYSDGGWTTPAADYAEYFEWADGNPNNEDRRGYSVSLVDKKIKIAEEGEMVIGIVSAKPSFVGDAHNDHWQAKYLLDEFGAEIQEEYNVISWTDIHGVKYGYEENNVPEDITVPEDAVIVVQTRSKLNPDFDPSQEYIARENRKEWTTVGMVGKLRMRKGQLTDPRWIKMRDISAEVEEWLVR